MRQANVKVNFLGGTLGGMPKLYDGIFQAYQDITPDVGVIGTYAGATVLEAQDKLLQLVSAGKPPDLYWVHSYAAAGLAALHVPFDLAPYLAGNRSVDRASYYPVTLADLQFAGQQFALPRDTTSVVLAYNKQLFQKAGVALPLDSWTWDDYQAAAQRLTAGTGGTKIWGTAGLIQTGYAYNSWIRLWQKGGDVVDGSRAHFTLGSPLGTQVYAWIAELVARGVHPSSAEGPFGNPIILFTTGRAAMMPTPSTYIALSTVKFDWDIQHLPNEGKRLTRASSSGHSLAAASTGKDAAWALLAYLSGAEAMGAYAAVGLTPAHRVAAERALPTADPKPPLSLRIGLDGLLTARPEPIAGDWLGVHQTIASALQDIYSPAPAPVQPALAAIADRVNQLLVTLPTAPM